MSIKIPTLDLLELLALSIYTFHRSEVNVSMIRAFSWSSNSFVGSSVHLTMKSAKAYPLIVDNGLCCVSNLLNSMAI